MKKKIALFVIWIAVIVTIPLLSFSQTQNQQNYATDFVGRYGYSILATCGHPTCNVQSYQVIVNNANSWDVVLWYKDGFDETFSCVYSISLVGGNISSFYAKRCGSSDFKCFEFCDVTIDLLFKLAEKENNGQAPSNNLMQKYQQQIANYLQKSIESLTCSDYCLGFLFLSWLDHGYSNGY